MSDQLRNPSSPRRGLLLPAVGVLAVLLIAAGLVSRRSQAELVRDSVAARALPTVSLVAPSAVAGSSLELPARIEAWSRAPIYARVSGYLQSWKVDIGSKVKAGQLLAQIDTPDLDQQIRQAQAELATARSNLALSTSTAQRWASLREAAAVSKQEADEKAGDLAAKQSVVQALSANVERQLALQRYTKLVAPFDGVVTARNTDVGALVSVGGAPGSELFVVSDMSRLRVYVNVPQRQVALIRPGSKALLSVPERPGRTYTATVSSQSQSINAATGGMLVQLVVENPANELLSGSFANVKFDVPAIADVLTVPPGVVILGKGGPQVAIVGQGDKVQVRPVTIVRDLGNVLQLGGEIRPGDRIISNPPDGIATGDVVRIAASGEKTATPK